MTLAGSLCREERGPACGQLQCRPGASRGLLRLDTDRDGCVPRAHVLRTVCDGQGSQDTRAAGAEPVTVGGHAERGKERRDGQAAEEAQNSKTVSW